MGRPGRIAAVLLVLASPAWADFTAGVKAFRAGNYEAAFNEWQPLADEGNATAQHNLGILYNYGLGVPVSFEIAAKWYRLAAEQGHSNAQAKLGYLLARGQGQPKDIFQAAKWFREAAEQGHAEAQFNIAMMYAMGSGVEEDRVQALMWLNLAADRGVGQARERRNELISQMPPADVEEAQLLADALKPQEQAEPSPTTRAAVTSVSATLAAARATVAPTPPTPEEGDIVVHLASYLSEQAAADGWAKLRTIHADLLGALGHNIVEVDLGDKGTFFRVQAGPLESESKAKALCSHLKRRNLYCATAF